MRDSESQRSAGNVEPNTSKSIDRIQVSILPPVAQQKSFARCAFCLHDPQTNELMLILCMSTNPGEVSLAIGLQIHHQALYTV